MEDLHSLRERLRQSVERRMHQIFGLVPLQDTYSREEYLTYFYGKVGKFSGTLGQYQWLEENYGITETEDVHWQLIQEMHYLGKPADECENEEECKERDCPYPQEECSYNWLYDNQRVIHFLQTLESKYYSKDIPFTKVKH